MVFFLMGSGCSEEKGLMETRVSRGRVPSPSGSPRESWEAGTSSTFPTASLLEALCSDMRAVS